MEQDNCWTSLPGSIGILFTGFYYTEFHLLFAYSLFSISSYFAPFPTHLPLIVILEIYGQHPPSSSLSSSPRYKLDTLTFNFNLHSSWLCVFGLGKHCLEVTDYTGCLKISLHSLFIVCCCRVLLWSGYHSRVSFVETLCSVLLIISICVHKQMKKLTTPLWHSRVTRPRIKSWYLPETWMCQTISNLEWNRKYYYKVNRPCQGYIFLKIPCFLGGETIQSKLKLGKKLRREQ